MAYLPTINDPVGHLDSLASQLQELMVMLSAAATAKDWPAVYESIGALNVMIVLAEQVARKNRVKV